MGEGPEAADMLSTLQAMSTHGGLMGGLPGVLNNPMQPPFPQQVLSPTWIQMNVIMLFYVQTFCPVLWPYFSLAACST